MARSLEKLQKQYNSTASHGMPGGMGGPGGHGPGRGGPPGQRHMRAKGKPKNTKNTIRRIMKYLSPYKGRFALVFLCMFVSTITTLLGSYMLAPIINHLTLAVKPDAKIDPSLPERIADRFVSNFVDPLGSFLDNPVMAYIFTAIAILGMIYLVGVICSYLQSRLMLSISLGSVEKIRNDLFTKLQTLSVRYYDSHPTGELMSRFTNDVDNIDVMLNNSLTSLVSGIISLIGTFVFMVTTSWILTVVTVLFFPLLTFGAAMVAKRSSKYYGSQQAALGAVNGYMEETITGQKVIKVFNHENDCVEEFELLNNDMRDKQFKAQFWGGVMGPIMHNISMICYGVTIGVGGVLMVLSGMTPGALTVFAGYSRQFAMPINMISQQTSMLFAALAGAERVFAVIDAPAEGEDGADPIAFGETNPASFEKAEPDHLDGYVVMDNVDFGYKADKKVLTSISLYAKPGQKIAFVGSTGAGKTTITNLLNRFYDIGEGSVTIDGYDIRSLDRSFLRRNVAMVLQDTNLFTGTVRENIRYGRPDATDEEVIEAAKTASAHSFIMRLEKGYDTVLEGNGSGLSQGQRQLLNIARAAISQAPILVLDEATSSVDTRTERHIEHGMERLMKNRTTFVIAHRLSTVRNANAIMVLEDGKIIERGTHDELLAMKGRYYELYTGKKELD